MRFKQFNAGRPIKSLLKNSRGFSLLELVVGLAIGGIVAAGVLGGYIVVCEQSKEQRDISVMAVNLRGAVENIEVDFRMAGFDPVNSGTSPLFGIMDVRRYEVTDDETVPLPNPGGSPALTIVYDEFNGVTPDGMRDITDTYISYRLFAERTGGGRTSIARDQSPGTQDWQLNTSCITPREVLADNILAITFAYAIDVNDDGALDTVDGTPNGPVIWAIDSDNDNVLDFNLDTNGNGVLDNDDDGNGDNFINATDADNWTGTAQLNQIVQVRIWILAQAEAPTDGYENHTEYYIGDRILSAENGDFPINMKCSLHVRSMEGRNL